MCLPYSCSFLAFQNSKADSYPQYLLERFKVAAPFPPNYLEFQVSQQLPRRRRKKRIFLGLFHFDQDGVQLVKLGLLVWALCSMFYWNRAERVSYSVIGTMCCLHARDPSVTSALR